MLPIEVVEWRPVLQNSLRGFASIAFPSGLIVDEISIHSLRGQCWASPPAQKMLNATGTIMTDARGKPMWRPFIRFRTKQVRDSWSRQVVDAVRLAHPAALADAAEQAA